MSTLEMLVTIHQGTENSVSQQLCSVNCDGCLQWEILQLFTFDLARKEVWLIVHWALHLTDVLKNLYSRLIVRVSCPV